MIVRANATARAVRRLAASLALTLVAGAGDAAHAHGGHGDPRVRAVIDEALPAALAGMRIEAHRTVAPQLVVENATGRLLEVLDADGVAFLRIGPSGVEANVAARAWYQTLAPGASVPAAVRDAANGTDARWQRVDAAHAFGWFEPRLDPVAVAVPDTVREAGVAADVARWQVALRVDGVPVTLAGTFRWEPAAAGAYRTSLGSPPEIAPGVRVRVLPGDPPGLLIENRTRAVLTVLDELGEPFLRIGRKGVEANVRSVSWAKSGRSANGADRGPAFVGAPYWQRVTRAPSYGWLDPRLAPRAAGEARAAWRIPVYLGATETEITGVSRWRTAAPSDAQALAAR